MPGQRITREAERKKAQGGKAGAPPGNVNAMFYGKGLRTLPVSLHHARDELSHFVMQIFGALEAKRKKEEKEGSASFFEVSLVEAAECARMHWLVLQSQFVKLWKDLEVSQKLQFMKLQSEAVERELKYLRLLGLDDTGRGRDDDPWPETPGDDDE